MMGVPLNGISKWTDNMNREEEMICWETTDWCLPSKTLQDAGMRSDAIRCFRLFVLYRTPLVIQFGFTLLVNIPVVFGNIHNLVTHHQSWSGNVNQFLWQKVCFCGFWSHFSLCLPAQSCCWWCLPVRRCPGCGGSYWPGGRFIHLTMLNQCWTEKKHEKLWET